MCLLGKTPTVEFAIIPTALEFALQEEENTQTRENTKKQNDAVVRIRAKWLQSFWLAR